MAKMTHPESDQTIDVSPDQQAMYASQGWERADGKSAADLTK